LIGCGRRSSGVVVVVVWWWRLRASSGAFLVVVLVDVVDVEAEAGAGCLTVRAQRRSRLSTNSTNAYQSIVFQIMTAYYSAFIAAAPLHISYRHLASVSHLCCVYPQIENHELREPEIGVKVASVTTIR